jgi:hypothetical protein
VIEPEILAILRPIIERYAFERLDGERFDDFVIRAGYISPRTEGKAWYEIMGGEGPYREIAALCKSYLNVCARSISEEFAVLCSGGGPAARRTVLVCGLGTRRVGVFGLPSSWNETWQEHVP